MALWNARGFLAAVLAIIINTLLFNLAGGTLSIAVLFQNRSGIGSLMLLVIGPLVGFMRDLVHRANHELSERIRAEEELRLLAAELAHQAHRDTLTGLPNRLIFEDRVEQAIANASRSDTLVAVMFLDLDGFKRVNDTYGHAVGDALLRQIARRLQAGVRKSDTVSRFGGDEFTLVLSNLKDLSQVARVAQSIIELFVEKFECRGQLLHVTASLGISLYPDEGESSHVLLTKADHALYQAKRQGKNTFWLYRDNLNQSMLKRLKLEGDLRHAVERGELFLEYQPQELSASRRVSSVEALVRWRHPEYGVLYPDAFISVAEETGQINAIGEWVLSEACRQARAWQRAGCEPVRVGVNVSMAQFQRPDFVEGVVAVFATHGLSPRWLELELTETVVMANVTDAVEKLKRLRALGVSIAIDDFGAGYSSLGYLKDLPLDIIKVDRSFVKDIDGSPTNSGKATSILMAIITLAHSLGMQVVVEGIETAAHLAAAQEAKSDRAQGYFLALPASPEAVCDKLAHRRQGLMSVGISRPLLADPSTSN